MPSKKNTSKQSKNIRAYTGGSFFTKANNFGTIDNKEILRRLSYTNNVVRICIQIIKNTTTQIPFYITTKPGHKVKDYEAEIFYLERLLKRPNTQDDTFRTIFSSVIEDILIFDSGVIEKVRNRKGEVIELYSVDGSTIFENRDDTGIFKDPAYLQYLSGSGDNGKPDAEFAMEDILMFRLNPGNGRYTGKGKSTIESILESVVGLFQATNYNNSFFDSNNTPPGIVNFKGEMESEELKQIADTWRNQVQKEAWSTMFSNADGLEHILARPNNQDMQFAELYEKMIQIVVSAFGLSVQDVGLVGDVNKATAQVQENVSKNRGVRNMMYLIKEEIQVDLIETDLAEISSRFGALEFTWEDIDKIDEKTTAEIDKIYLESGVAGYDKIVQKRLGIEIEELENNEDNDNDNDVEEKSDQQLDEERENNELQKTQKHIHKATEIPDRPLSTEEKRVDFAAIENQLDFSEEMIVDKFSEVIETQKQRVKDEIIRAVNAEDLTEAGQVTFFKLNAVLPEVQRQVRLTGSFSQAQALAEISKQQNLQKQVNQDEVTEIETVNNTETAVNRLNEEIQNIAVRSVSQNMSEEEIDTAVEDTSNKFLNTTAALLAAALIMGAFNRKRKQIFDSEDIVVAYRYSAIMDGRTTQYCRSLNGKIFSKEEAGNLMPPNHFRCRSILVPITNTQETTDIGDISLVSSFYNFKDESAL